MLLHNGIAVGASRRALLLLALWCALPALAAPDGNKPLVVATLKPLALIAQAVLGETAEVRQLLAANVSPHGYALRISERRLLAEADLVFWVGPSLESFLADALAATGSGRQLIAAQLPGMHWPEGAHAHGEEPLHLDHHVWLDPRNAAVMARGLVEALVGGGQIEPSVLTAAVAFEEKMSALEAELARSLATVRDTPFAGDHDAFGHFAARFGLHPAGYLRDAAGHAGGARSVSALLARKDIHCLVAEPDSRMDSLRHLAARWDARLVVIDTLGAELPGSANYSALLRSVAQGFGTCLGSPPPQ